MREGLPLHPGAEPGLCRLRTEGLGEWPRLPAERHIHWVGVGPVGSRGEGCGVCRRDSTEVLVAGNWDGWKVKWHMGVQFGALP